jgi:hypothetical protein
VTLDKVKMQRLAFVKYLYTVAVEQTNRPEPMCYASILTFHDAIELFLQLSSEEFDISKEDIPLMAYWDALNSKIAEIAPGQELTQKESVRRLNKARRELKHHGTWPNKLDIEAHRATATAFFSENTTTIFAIDFSSISLVEIVQNENVRKELKQAQEKLKQGVIADALTQVALAFRKLIDDYEDKGKDRFGRSPFFFGESMSFLDASSVVGSGLGPYRKLYDFVDHTAKSVEALQDALKILSLGIDYRRFARFQSVTPHVIPIVSGPYQTYDRWAGTKDPRTANDVEFCIDFVIETALHLQEFEFNLEKSN